MRASDIRKFPWTRTTASACKSAPARPGSSSGYRPRASFARIWTAFDRRGALVMLTTTGKAFTKRYFNECWREDANAVGSDKLNFHDSRGTAATLLAEAGATAPEIAEAYLDGRQGPKGH